jgi:hypothetical protein
MRFKYKFYSLLFTLFFLKTELGKMDSKTRTRIVPIHGTKMSSILVVPKHGSMPKNGHVFNLLRLLKLESATRTQINKYFPTSGKVLHSVMKDGYVVENDGKFCITHTGILELKKLKTKISKT